eukprot:3035109-Pleurochrysis_carterae.AAC.1
MQVRATGEAIARGTYTLQDPIMICFYGTYASFSASRSLSLLLHCMGATDLCVADPIRSLRHAYVICVWSPGRRGISAWRQPAASTRASSASRFTRRRQRLRTHTRTRALTLALAHSHAPSRTRTR